jgi:tRNA threonylcarbamoyl adenosine modification protein YeaZ
LLMTILALEFSSLQRSVAVLRTGDGQIAAEAVESGGRNTAAFCMIEKVLAETKIVREEINVIAVGLGPGSYTGIRAAIALSQGWQLARGVKLLGLSGVECLAAQAQAENILGRVTVAIDAQRNEFYLATYEISADGRKEIEPLKILPLAEIQSRFNAAEILIGPEVTKWFPNGRTIFPSAAVLAKLAVGKNDFAAGEKLEPVYLRTTNFVKAPPHRLIAS